MTAYYRKHVFICTNQKPNGKKCCQMGDAEQFFTYTKKRVSELEQQGPGKIRISKSGCLGRCDQGPCMVVYPEQIWYGYRDTDDLDQIIEQHLLKDQPIAALQLRDDA